MPRGDATPSIVTKSARAALQPRREPYFQRLEPGLYVGFRRTAAGSGSWVARRLDRASGRYRFHALGDGLEYAQARRLAEAWDQASAMGVAPGMTTVAEACRLYVEHQRLHKSAANAADAEGRFRRLVDAQPIGRLGLDKLTTRQLRAWVHAQLDQQGDEAALRRSKDSVNRNLTALKAALNLALRDRLVASDAGWKTVLPFAGAGRRRTQDLDAAQRTALLEQCEPALAALVRALLLTAVRPGEIAQANVEDFNAVGGTLRLAGKTGERVVTLSTQAVGFFKKQAHGKLPAAPLLSDAGGSRWHKDGWKKGFRRACEAAGLPDGVVLYTLRHCAISEMIAGGMDAFLVARLAGTSTAMIDKHYGHLRHASTRARLDAVAIV